MVLMTLITAEVLCAMSQDAFVNVSGHGICRSSFMQQLLTLRDDGIEPTIFDA